jgi:hypothetical protein
MVVKLSGQRLPLSVWGSPHRCHPNVTPSNTWEHCPPGCHVMAPGTECWGASRCLIAVVGEMISHGPQDYARGTATRTPMESLHLVFIADRHLYQCELETYAGDLARYSEVFRFLCASVGPSRVDRYVVPSASQLQRTVGPAGVRGNLFPRKQKRLRQCRPESHGARMTHTIDSELGLQAR